MCVDVAAVPAGAVRQLGLATLRTGNQVRRRQRVVRAPCALSVFRFLMYWLHVFSAPDARPPWRMSLSAWPDARRETHAGDNSVRDPEMYRSRRRRVKAVHQRGWCPVLPEFQAPAVPGVPNRCELGHHPAGVPVALHADVGEHRRPAGASSTMPPEHQQAVAPAASPGHRPGRSSGQPALSGRARRVEWPTPTDWASMGDDLCVTTSARC